jgi:gamma-glutamyl-gamma-aminobutyrate hydrolase PuuD
MSDNNSSNPGKPGTEPPAAHSVGSDPAEVPFAKAADLMSAAQPGADATAAERASTDAPESASTIEPVDTAKAQREDAAARAAQARQSAATAPHAQETTAHVIGETPAVKVSLAEQIETATEAQAAEEENAEQAESAENAAPPAVAKGLPADFTTAPDFGASHLPPPIPPGTQNSGQPPPAYLHTSDSAWSVLGRVIRARARRIFDRAGQRVTQRTLRIGVSARIFHPEPGAKGLRGKTLQYLEESIAHWVMSRDVLVFMIPTVGHQGMLHPSNIRLRDYAKHLDGLLLQGGADVSPQSYAEAAIRTEWPGDRVRDMYELELLHEFIESGKPVLGVCRGCQLINVAFGGTLYQDIATEMPHADVHVNEQYDQHRHPIKFPDGSTLVNMFPGRRDALVNSIHHQAVKTIGRDLNVEAVSAADGIIEAVRYRRAPFVMGVQWHPEFHRAGGDELLDCTPLLDTFLRVARETRF